MDCENKTIKEDTSWKWEFQTEADAETQTETEPEAEKDAQAQTASKEKAKTVSVLENACIVRLKKYNCAQNQRFNSIETLYSNERIKLQIIFRDL